MRKKAYIGLLIMVLAASMIGCSKGNTDTGTDIMTSTDGDRISTDTDSEEIYDEDTTTAGSVKDKKEEVSSESVSHNENSSTNAVTGNNSTSSNENNCNGATETVAGSSSQTPVIPSGNSGSNTQTPSGSSTPAASGSQTPTAPTPTAPTPTAPTPTAPTSSNHAGQTWHSPEYEMVWIVDKAAWTEEIPKYESVCKSICNQCGADITGHASEHITNPDNLDCYSYHAEYYDVQVGTTTISHSEEGHWEEQLVKEGYWE